MGSMFMTVLVLALLFIAIVLLVMALAPLFASRVDLDARLSGPAVAAMPAGGPSGSLRSDRAQSVWAKLVTEIERRGLSLTDSKSDVLTERLMLAGYDQPYAVRAFVLARTVLTIALPLLVVAGLSASGAEISPGKLYMVFVGAALFGLYLPNIIVGSQATNRRQEILNGFPDTLDLMLVCVEAGLGIDAAFSRVGTEITQSHPLLARMFATVSLELRAGRSREQALRTLARRSGVPEIGAFVTLIIQSDKLGASISQALKVYAAEMREGRRMRAEEKAHRIPVLLSVPLVCFLLPTMVSVLMLPAAISMKQSMAESAKSNN